MKTLQVLFIVMLTVVLGANAAETVDYRGALPEVADAAITLTFNLYSSADGAEPILTETRTVDVVDGAFDVSLPGEALAEGEFFVEVLSGDVVVIPREPLERPMEPMAVGLTIGKSGEDVYIDGDRVGIGTTAPNMKLDVNGSAQIQDVLRGGNWRHVLSDGFTSTATNGYLLTTSIPYDGATQRGMHTVRICGYAYGNQKPIDFVVNFYLYTSGFSSYGWTNYGSYDPGTVKLSFEGGYVKIWWSTNVYYPSFEVFTTSWIGSVDTDAYFEGWDITDAASPSTDVVDVPYKNAEPQGLTMGGNIALSGNYLSGDGGNEGVFVANSGNVGIGTDSPTQKLDVNGQIRIQGGDPGANKVLTSDANGVATWQDPPSNLGQPKAVSTDRKLYRNF